MIFSLMLTITLLSLTIIVDILWPGIINFHFQKPWLYIDVIIQSILAYLIVFYIFKFKKKGDNEDYSFTISKKAEIRLDYLLFSL